MMEAPLQKFVKWLGPIQRCASGGAAFTTSLSPNTLAIDFPSSGFLIPLLDSLAITFW